MAGIGLQSERGAVCNLVSEIAISGGGEGGRGQRLKREIVIWRGVEVWLECLLLLLMDSASFQVIGKC